MYTKCCNHCMCSCVAVWNEFEWGERLLCMVTYGWAGSADFHLGSLLQSRLVGIKWLVVVKWFEHGKRAKLESAPYIFVQPAHKSTRIVWVERCFQAWCMCCYRRCNIGVIEINVQISIRSVLSISRHTLHVPPPHFPLQREYLCCFRMHRQLNTQKRTGACTDLLERRR